MSERMLDPVCDMIVNLEASRDTGLTLEMESREFAFCGPRCQSTFAKNPGRYIPKVDAWLRAGRPDTGVHDMP